MKPLEVAKKNAQRTRRNFLPLIRIDDARIYDERRDIELYGSGIEIRVAAWKAHPRQRMIVFDRISLSEQENYKMATETITIRVDTEAAEAYRAASPEEQKKIQLLLGLWLKEVASAETISLKQLMSDISEKAKARGLTPEDLESILNED